MSRSVRVTTPPDTFPPFFAVRELFWEYIAPLFVGFDNANRRAATLRWRANNAAEPCECPCGQPGTVRVTHPDGGFVGDVSPIWWRCDEHVDDPLNAQYVNGRRVTRDECRSWTYSSKTGVVSSCGCGTHIGEVRQ